MTSLDTNETSIYASAFLSGVGIFYFVFVNGPEEQRHSELKLMFIHEKTRAIQSYNIGPGLLAPRDTVTYKCLVYDKNTIELVAVDKDSLRFETYLLVLDKKWTSHKLHKRKETGKVYIPKPKATPRPPTAEVDEKLEDFMVTKLWDFDLVHVDKTLSITLVDTSSSDYVFETENGEIACGINLDILPRAGRNITSIVLNHRFPEVFKQVDNPGSMLRFEEPNRLIFKLVTASQLRKLKAHMNRQSFKMTFVDAARLLAVATLDFPVLTHRCMEQLGKGLGTATLKELFTLWDCCQEAGIPRIPLFIAQGMNASDHSFAEKIFNRRGATLLQCNRLKALYDDLQGNEETIDKGFYQVASKLHHFYNP
ncbi:hypothetical protein CJU90_4004 [Yarrowia sp. C11]|nr:hypothetical protein CKK34_5616 [Yarrowia sp. E02]KAG5367699.1 hypothetical protein CJU90_4004 [Yarrowia sp. C11]